MASENPIVECCVCGNALAYNDAVMISLSMAITINETQGLFAHIDCIDKTLHKDVPRLFETLSRTE